MRTLVPRRRTRRPPPNVEYRRDDGPDSTLPRTGEEAVRRLERLLRKLAAKRVRGTGLALEDFVQELRVQVWLSYEDFDPARGALATWAVWVVRNHAVKLRRQAARWRREVNGCWCGRVEGETDPVRDAPARPETDAYLVEEVRAAVARLPQLECAVVCRMHGITGVVEDAAGVGAGGSPACTTRASVGAELGVHTRRVARLLSRAERRLSVSLRHLATVA